MRPYSLVLCLVVCNLAGVIPIARTEDKPAPLSVSYTYAGLTEITVKDGKLHYVWHTERQWGDGKRLDRSNLANYDRHQVDIWLTVEELERVQRWAARRKLFEFDKDYPSPPGGNSPGAAFQSGLTIVHGDKKHAISWAGDSKTPEALDVAVSRLIELADEVQKSRSK